MSTKSSNSPSCTSSTVLRSSLYLLEGERFLSLPSLLLALLTLFASSWEGEAMYYWRRPYTGCFGVKRPRADTWMYLEVNQGKIEAFIASQFWSYSLGLVWFLQLSLGSWGLWDQTVVFNEKLNETFAVFSDLPQIGGKWKQRQESIS